MAVKIDPTAVLPDEMVREVFSHLSTRDLGACSGVSRAWNRHASDEELWTEFFASANISVEQMPGKLKDLFQRIVIRDKTELLEKIREFSSGLNKNTQAEFLCSYFNEDAGIRIRFGKTQPGPFGLGGDYAGDPTVRKHVVYRDRLADNPHSASAAASEVPEDVQAFGMPIRELFASMGTNASVSSQSGTLNGIKISIHERVPTHDDSIANEAFSILTQRLEDIDSRNGRLCKMATVVAGAAFCIFIAMKRYAPEEL